MARLAALPSQEIRVIGLVSFGHLLSHFYFFVLPPLLPLLQEEFRVDYVLLALPMASFAVAAGITQTPVGFLVDRLGARRVLLCGLALQGASIAAIGLTVTFWQLLALYTIAGVANTVFHPADYAILSGSIAKERLGRAFSIHLFSGNFGWVLTPAVMGGLTWLWDWRTAFLVVGGIGMLFALLMWSQSRHLDEEVGHRTGDRTAAKERDGLLEGVRLLLSIPILMCLLFFVLLTVGFTGVRSFIVVALDQMYGMPLITANSILTGFMAGSAAGILAGGVLADRYGPRIATAAGTLISAAVLLVVVGTYALPTGVILVAITASGVLQGLLLPSRDLLIRAVTPPGSMGKVMGFLSTGMMAASAAVQPVFGWLMDIGAARWVFWVSAIFIASALLGFAGARGASADPAK